MGCVKLHILDEQYKSTELKVSYINKELTLNNSAVKAYRYLFTGYERDQESGLDYMGARYRNVEAVIPLSTDRFWFKTPHLSPYNFAANNPMRYVDVNGDSVGVTSNITNNAALNESFNLFASSKEGIKFLSDYAAKGQTIVGHTYTKDGKYHKKDVNLYYTAEDLGVDGEGGNTTNGDNGLSYVVTINSNPITFLNGRQYSVNGKYPDSYLLSQVIALFHESFIHVDLFVRDLMSNGVGRDYDCFPDYIRSLSKTTLYRKEAHHAFVKYYDNASPLFPAAALRGVIEVNSRLGNIYSKSLLEKMIWYYHGGKY